VGSVVTGGAGEAGEWAWGAGVCEPPPPPPPHEPMQCAACSPTQSKNQGVLCVT